MFSCFRTRRYNKRAAYIEHFCARMYASSSITLQSLLRVSMCVASRLPLREMFMLALLSAVTRIRCEHRQEQVQ